MANIIRKFSLNIKPNKDKNNGNAKDAVTSPDDSASNSPAASRKSIGGLASVKSDLSAKDSHDGHGKKLGALQSMNPFKKDDASRRSSSDLPRNRDGEDMSKNQLRKHKKHEAEEQKLDWHTRQAQDMARRREEEAQHVKEVDSQEQQDKYGWLPINNYSGEPKHLNHIDLRDLVNKKVGDEVAFRARVHTYRKMSAKLAFFVFRQQTQTIQGVLQQSDHVSATMVHWAEHVPVETIVNIIGIIQPPKAKEGEVKGTSVHDKEIMITQMHVVSKLHEHIPFTVYEAETTQEEADAENSTRHHVGERARMQSRILDLRTTTSQAIFRVQSGVCTLFRGFLDSQGFLEIHSPKLQGGATESGASVFTVNYFNRTAFLAQSPQLAKQMSIASDFGKVYEVGPVFRAENSNTHRHLTEYTGLDIEMAIDEHYHEALRTIDRTLKTIFEGIYKKYRPEIDAIKRQFPHEDLVWLEHTLVLKFRDAIQILNDSGWRDEHGNELPLDEDLGTRDEIQMGKVIKEKFKTDYYILDKFPTSARPFYTMQDPENPTYTNSFDIFVRGQEIISGGQRVHDAEMLTEQMQKAKIDPKVMEEYMQGFEWGAPPHAGAGVGLERLVMLLLALGDIRNASMFPRDPKSLPAKPAVVQLRHPESSTLHPPWAEARDKKTAHKDYQPLENLIANYGDASNTSWLEERNKIWRDAETGAAVSYVPHKDFAITVGDPLCHVSQYTKIIANYLDFIKKETELKPLWLLCGQHVETALAERFDWRTFSCAAEQRVELTANSKTFQNTEVQRKVRHAEKEGVKIKDIEFGSTVPKDLRDKIDLRIKDWLGARKSHQHVHLTEVTPWNDMAHRQYHYAVDSSGQIASLCVMAQLSPEHGWQVKYALDFPNSPSGCAEAVIIHALKAAQTKGAKTATFGGGASSEFVAGHNMKGAKVKILSKAYHTIANDLKLTQKSEFREKLGAEDDPIYVCYPPKGLGPKGIHAILTFFED